MKKSTWIILAIVVVLGVVYYLTKKDHISVGVKRLELPSFDRAKVDTIEVTGHGNVLLKKTGDKWQLQIGEGAGSRLVDANQSYVEEMLDAAAKVGHSHYVSENAEKHEELGLGKEKATTVILKANDTPVWSLMLGKNNPDSTRYARRPDDNNVYAVRGSFFALTRNNVNDWREKDFWHLEEPQVVSFGVQNQNKGTFNLTKDEEGHWKIAKAEPPLSPSFRPNPNALASLVRSNLNLRASGFVDDKKDLPAPLVVVTANTKDGKEQIIEIFPGNEHHYWARKKGADQIFEIAKSNFDRINKPLSELRDYSVMNIDKKAIVKLKLASKKGAVVVEKTNNEWHLVEPKKLPAQFEFDPKRSDEIISLVAELEGNRLADLSKDKPFDQDFQKSWLLELTDDQGKLVHLYATRSKQNAEEHLVKGNVDQEIYVVKNPRLSHLAKGLEAFKKEEFVLPPIDENTKGFESLPVDIQRKLLESTKQKKQGK